MDDELETEVLKKYVLHWNYRGYSEFPEELKIRGDHVQEIYLKSNNLSYLPSWLGQLQHLSNLYLQHNRLCSLPDAIGDLKSLTVLDISHNRLNALPSTIGHSKCLTDLLAANNNLTDLPNEIVMLQSLERLDLSSNMLHWLPACVCECQALQELLLDNNQITSLPNKIVYLPSLAALSICGNQLLYLPMLPFSSSPCLRFNDNPHLNYISLVLGCQVTANSGIDICGGLWDLRMHGCFHDFDAVGKLDHHIIVEKQSEIMKKELFLVIPKPLQYISSGTAGCNLIPTLQELAMRVVYSFGYHHYMEMDSENRFIRQRRNSIGVRPFSILPIQLQHQLINGPVTLCYFQLCQRPIFTFGTVWVIPQCCISENRDGITSILSIVAFCSLNCSTKYAQWENDREGSMLETLWERKLHWHVKRK